MKLESTKNYGMFVPNAEQRQTDDNHIKRIASSISTFGFLPSKPIQCYRKGPKLIVTDGHHRLKAAQSVGSEVFYVIESDRCQKTMAPSNALVKKWSVMDYVRMYAVRGIPEYNEILEYSKKGIPVGMAASMLCNHMASSGNTSIDIQNGTFKIRSREHIDSLCQLIDDLGEQCPAVRSRPFISAYSKCLFTPEFDNAHFTKRLHANWQKLDKTSNEDQMLRKIEEIYNHRSHDVIPLAFFVSKCAKERKISFGR